MWKPYDVECARCLARREVLLETQHTMDAVLVLLDNACQCGSDEARIVPSTFSTPSTAIPTKIPRVRRRVRPEGALLFKPRDLECVACAHAFGALVHRDHGFGAEVDEVCPKCSHGKARVLVSMPTISINVNPERAHAIKKARCKEDSIREVAREPEKHGFTAATRPRGWNKRSHAKTT